MKKWILGLIILGVGAFSLFLLKKEEIPFEKEFFLQTAMTENKPSISFSKNGNRFFGNAGINRYFGTFKKEGNKIVFSRIGTTLMAGSPKDMQAEQDFLAELNRVEKYQYKKGKLILITIQGKELLFTEK